MTNETAVCWCCGKKFVKVRGDQLFCNLHCQKEYERSRTGRKVKSFPADEAKKKETA